MVLKTLNQRSDLEKDSKLERAYIQFGKLISELRNKELSDDLINFINIKIEEINLIPNSGKELRNKIKRNQSKIIQRIEREMKIVPKNYYRNTWLAVGMAAFGIPIGAAFGASSGNMGLLGIGLPIGMVIGIAVGTGMDKKAFEEGRQLDLELKY